MDMPPVLSADEFRQEARAIMCPPFRSSFGGVRWQDLGKRAARYDWLVKGMIAEREVSFLAGPSQSGKSFLATDLALCIARGRAFFGMRVKKGAVVYVAAESSQGVISLRLPAYAKGHSLSYDDPLHFLTLTKSPNFYRDAEGVERLIKEITAYEANVQEKVELVVLDTFSAASRGIDEIKGVDVGKIHERIRAVVDQCKCAVLVVHHMNAGGDRMRGHSSLFGDVDSVITCQVHETKQDAIGRPIRIAKADKVKEGANKFGIEFCLKSIELGFDDDGDRISSCIVERPSKADDSEIVEEEKGIRLSETKRLHFAVLLEAIRKFGRPPPPELDIRDGRSVVEKLRWLEIYRAKTPDQPVSAEPEVISKWQDAMRKRVDGALKAFMNLNIVNHHDGLVYLTGRRVSGFNAAIFNMSPPPKPPQSPPPEIPVSAEPDIGSHLDIPGENDDLDVGF